MQFSRRMDNLAPYLFAGIELKIAEKRKQGVDVISLGIGDPDIPTPAYIVEEMQRQVADPRNHRYPSNRGLLEYGEAATAFYKRRFGVELDPEKEFMALLGAKEGLAHICMALLDAGDLALVPDPGYPVYAGGSIMMGAEVKYLELRPENGFLPDFEAVPLPVRKAAKLMFLNYPNNPTGAVADLDFFSRAVDFARENEIIIVHDCAYSEVRYDGYATHSILEVEGAGDVAIEMHSFSKTFNMTGWRVAWACGGADFVAALSKAKSNIDSGTFMAVQRAGIAALGNYDGFIGELNAEYQRRRDASRRIGGDVVAQQKSQG